MRAATDASDGVLMAWIHTPGFALEVRAARREGPVKFRGLLLVCHVFMLYIHFWCI